MKKYFTKEDIKTVIELWNTKTKEEIAEQLGRSVYSITYISSAIRKAGYDLPRKSIKHERGQFIKRILKEEGYI